MGWGLRVVDSQGLHVYGAVLYSFFNNYDAGLFISIHHAQAVFQLLTWSSATVLRIWRQTELPELHFQHRGGFDHDRV